MSGRTLEASRRWMDAGTDLFSAALERAVDDLSRPSSLPRWTRAHVVAHVSANADAIGNLVTWASSGDPTPMYASTEERDAAIDRGANLRPSDLVDWYHTGADNLRAAMDQLTAEHWSAEVVTAQGRTVPASETPWMRAREVMVHVVDLDVGVSFDNLPLDAIEALHGDIIHRRGIAQVPVLRGPFPQVVAHLAGRTSRGVTDASGEPAAPMTPWL
jgi:maleylpyruvate isomerase